MAKLRYILVQIALAGILCGIAGCAKPPADLHYEPTGHALYDRFALLVLDQLDETWPDGRLDFSAVMGWEAEFESDPEYWQLRALIALEGQADAMFNVFIEGKQPYVDTLLLEKIAGGMADPACFASLLWASDGKDNISATLQLIDQAIAGSPEYSHFYYIRAALLLDSGGQLGISSAIEAGNKATLNERVYGFPFNKVLVNPLELEAPGNQAVAGYLSNLHFQRTLVEQVHLKNFFLSVLQRTDLTPEELDQLLIAAQRLGSRQHTALIGQLSCLGYLKDIERAIPFQGLSLSQMQLSELAALFAIGDALKLEISGYGEQKAATDATDTPSQPTEVPGQQAAQQWWKDVLLENAFVADLQSKLDPFADPPFSKWFLENQTP